MKINIYLLYSNLKNYFQQPHNSAFYYLIIFNIKFLIAISCILIKLSEILLIGSLGLVGI